MSNEHAVWSASSSQTRRDTYQSCIMRCRRPQCVAHLHQHRSIRVSTLGHSVNNVQLVIGFPRQCLAHRTSTHTHSHTRTQAKLNAHRKFVWHTRRVDAQKPNKKALATSRARLLGSLSAWNCLPSPISIAPQIYQFEVSATRKVGEENFMNYSTTLGAAQRKAGMQNRPETG